MAEGGRQLERALIGLVVASVVAAALAWLLSPAWSLLALPAALAALRLYVRPRLRAIDEAHRALEARADEALQSADLQSQFLANMSHEIRTPMTGVLGLTRLMQEMALPPKLRRYAEALESAGRSLLTVVNDVLDFSKLEAGKYAITEADLDVAAVTLDAVQLLAESARQKGLELCCRVDEGVPSVVRSDPDRYRQVLTNLVGNAVKFTLRGEVMVDVSARPIDARAVELQVEVRDTGIGIDEQAKGEIFEAFFQQEGEVSRRFGGTGLGLAISKRLIETMGGRLSFDSKAGVGSRFWLTLAVSVPEGAAAVVRAELGGRVLLVERSERWRGLIAEQLATWKVGFETADSAEQALAQLNEAAGGPAPFHALVLASTSQDAGAVELLRRVLASPVLAMLPIVYLDRLGEPPLPDELSAHLVAQLHKPLRMPQLYDSLAAILQARPSRRTRAQAPSHARVEGALPMLLVEDNEINELVAVEQLAHLGYEVDVARNGREALEAIGKRRYAAVLMDCQMPVMDGYEASRAVRTREAPGEHLPIIALTAHALAGERAKVLASGMDDYLTKPLRPEALRNALARHLKVPVERAAAAPTFSTAARGRADHGDDELDPETPREPDVVALFLELVPKQIDALARAIAESDASETRAQAHKVKGSGLAIGARRFSRIANELQLIAEAGRLTLAREKLDELRGRFELVRERLDRSRPDGPVAS